ncbi:MAG: TetR/AcrR family transcriptional regulator [bacterium]
MTAKEIMNHDDRKLQILSTAQEFFFSRGYEQTSVQAIIDAVGIAKGTFYHYFDSKDELLTEWIIWQVDRVMEEIGRILDREDLDFFAKFTLMHEHTGTWKRANAAMMVPMLRILYGDENIVLRTRMNSVFIDRLSVYYTRLIEEGNRDNVFPQPFPYPEVAAKLIISLGLGIGKDIADLYLSFADHPENRTKIEELLLGYENSINRILGLPDGSLKLFDLGLIDEIIKFGGSHDNS